MPTLHTHQGASLARVAITPDTLASTRRNAALRNPRHWPANRTRTRTRTPE